MNEIEIEENGRHPRINSPLSECVSASFIVKQHSKSNQLVCMCHSVAQGQRKRKIEPPLALGRRTLCQRRVIWGWLK